MDKYSIDSHKLMYHIDRVNDWLEGKNIYPIYIEISPTGACNHRCVFCGLDFMEYKPRFLDKNVLKNRLFEMGSLGLKSVMYAGEGEPLLHKDIEDIILCTKKACIDVAITTNGVLLDKIFVDKTLGSTEWIKISIDAGTKETYSKIHRANPKDFDRVIENLRYAVNVRNDNDYKVTLGMQLLLLPDNCHEVELLAKIAKDIGIDYLVIKPYSQHLLGKGMTYKNIKYEDYLHLSGILEKYNNEKFNIIFRISTMNKWDEATNKWGKGEHEYRQCLALPFWSYIDAGGNIWGCSCFLGDERFHYGNINDDTFEAIWTGEKRKRSLQLVGSELDVSWCRINCRMDKINKYLWNLKHPINHINFI